MKIPHGDHETVTVHCGIVTVSDTRTPETDGSGQLIQQQLQDAGHKIIHYCIIKDEPTQIKPCIEQLTQESKIEVIIVNGGTGIAPRDRTYDTLDGLLEKTLPGFGELFRYLSYQEIGSRAMASRAIAGIYRQTLIFSLPGSTNAVQLALDTLIIPELIHLTKQLQS